MNRNGLRRPRWWGVVFALQLLGLTACRSGDEVAPTRDSGVEGDGAAADNGGACGKGEYASTFAAIQQVIFEGYNCTNNMCHGDAAAGGLDLRAGVSYENLLQVESSSSPMLRVMPADPQQSFLFNKLRAATNPGSVKIQGTPMPSGTTPLSPEHLEAVRRWIEAGAPREGSIGDSVTGRADGIAELLGACLPEATPVAIAPLEPPAPNEGVQLKTAPIKLQAGTEIDVCWAQYYDVSDIVPLEFQDRERGLFYVNGQRTRQDPLSHHLVISDSGLGPDSVNDPAFGAWTCRGEDGPGEPCDPLQRDACKSGICASAVAKKVACQGFGPVVEGRGPSFGEGMGKITGSQTAQYYQPPREGVYETIPIRGIMYVNPHAFNLTSHDATLHGWINLFYAQGDLTKSQELKRLNALDNISLGAGTPPFGKKSVCASWIAPLNSKMYSLSSHTHKRGRHFTVELFGGMQIYTSEIYSDPVVEEFDPPMIFDDPDPEKRKMTYCAEFNNGVDENGEPDVDLVTRLSTMPERTTCKPVACVSGNVGAACNGADDHGACDTSPDAGDGWCDACAITRGLTTEDEMFIMIPMMVVPDS